MTLRDQRQKELAQKWLDDGRWGIIYAAPRFGKIRTTIHILKAIKPKSILIAYPDNKIKQSWEDDFKEMRYKNENIQYTTHLSLHKYQDEEFDIVIIDEIHLLSEAQMEAASVLLRHNPQVLGLTGTMTAWTQKTLMEELELPVVAEYSIEQAVSEGVIVDYEIHVIKVPLDTIVIQDFKGKKRTEKKHFDSCSWVIDQMEVQGRNTMFLRLARMRIIQNSIAKMEATKTLLTKYKNERILVFCGVTKIADALGIPSYHSKSSEKQLFEDFAAGKGNHLAVIKLGNTGVTYKPLNRVIINYFDSNAENLAQRINRCMAMEYNNPDKKAIIYIISTDEPVELRWLSKALEFFDKSKIKFV